ncbi:MAG: glycosyltransferase family 4 protein [Rhodospirillaceae bacterium]|nr:glycosyltransferase family 4 protein [Rhodospirillaceae bacterium]MBT6857177.1 glycosyltransferase family 4 protein [Rhodospirillaceae bacterium]
MPAIIDFSGLPDTGAGPLGIDVATREFLRGFFRHAGQNQFACLCPNDKAFTEFTNFAAEENIAASRCTALDRHDATAIEASGALVRYDPDLVSQAWLRRYHSQRRYSLIGIAHASASTNAMQAIGDYLAAPLQSWDALICPSAAIRSAVAHIIDGWGEYLGARFGADLSCPVQLPVIPLGVDTARMATVTGEAKRQSQRRALALSDNEIAILYVGRLNYVAKANPLALFIAAEETAKRSSRPVRVLLNGYFNDDVNEDAFMEAANAILDVAKLQIIRHGDEDFPDGVWAAADIFCSLSDNIQESFGLTPVEAMAAGLPSIVSDWNGYRESIRDGIDGYCIPTTMAPPGTGGDIAYRYFTRQNTYGDYLGAQSQSTSVDVGALGQALYQLVNDDGARRTMAEAAKKRARETYDWARVIGLYENLWDELSQARVSETVLGERQDGQAFHPSHPDPFAMFSGFASQALGEGDLVQLTGLDWNEAFQRIKLKAGLVYSGSLMELEELPFLIGHLEANPGASVADILGAMPHVNADVLQRTLVWLMKLGICRTAPGT